MTQGSQGGVLAFEPLIRLPGAWTSVFERFGVHMFEGRVTVGEMDRMQAIAERWLKRRPGKIVELVVIFPSDTRMSHDERTRMVRLIKHGEAHRLASATVILAGGLLGSMQRSVLTGMMMLVPAPHPVKVFGGAQEGVHWLLPHIRSCCGDGVMLADLQAATAVQMKDFLARPDRDRALAAQDT